jgi:methylisocitrate lyase
MTALGDVLEDVRRITSATSRPLLVDVDTGFAGAFMIGRTVREMVKAGAAGVHIEDQVQEKRCGHRPNKMLVGADEMVARIHAAVDGRTDPNFFLIARTDAVAVEGMAAAVERSIQYMEAGADAIFAEALTDLDEYRRFSSSLSVPILANMTEFGRTPLFTVEELRDAGVSMALYPLSAFRAMSAAALRVYDTIRKDGTQKNVVEEMQTRDELYEVLNYRHYEERLDRLLRKEKRDGR